MNAITWVKNHLELQGIACEHSCHAPGPNAQTGPHGEHFDKRRLAKTVVVMADGRPVVLVVPATRRLCLDRALEQLHAQKVKLANDAEVKFHFPDCEPGTVPPLRHWNGAPLVIDPSMRVEGDIYFYAGTHHDLIRVGCEDWLRFVHPREALLVADPDAEEVHVPQEAGSPDQRMRATPQQLVRWLIELIDVLHLEAKELERLVEHVEQHAGPLAVASQIPLCASELSELKGRLATACLAGRCEQRNNVKIPLNAH